MEIRRNINRRTLLGIASGALATLILPDTGFAQENKPTPTPTEKPLPSPIFVPVVPVQTLNVGEATSLQKLQVEGFKKDLKKVLSNEEIINVFTGIHGLTRHQVIESLDIYYPMYRMAAAENAVEGELPDWFIYAVLHAAECNFSLLENSKLSGYVGGWQRDDEFYSNEIVRKFGIQYRYMRDSRQRYKGEVGSSQSDDVAELFWAADHIRERGIQRYPGQSAKQAARNVVAYSYSRDGSYRAVLIDQLSEIHKRNNLP